MKTKIKSIIESASQIRHLERTAEDTWRTWVQKKQQKVSDKKNI